MSEVPPALHLAPAPAAKPPRPRIKKLRLLLVLVPLSCLALISTAFGMMMAVAADLPALEQLPQIAKRKNSVLQDVRGRTLTTLTANDGRIIVSSDQISPYVKWAVIAIEDQRFYENAGVDLRGTVRALYQDVLQGRAAQGGSTIAQQFIKNALGAQGDRTILQKVREGALAYHLTRKWSKDRILTEYLNTVYFGNGAYGVEAAARTYFSSDPDHLKCGTAGHKMCAAQLTPHEAALLAAIIASPSGYDPVANYGVAMRRRNLVLNKMLDQGRITPRQLREEITQPLYGKPTPPTLETTLPGSEYFVSWVRQSLVDQVGPQRAFEGNLRVRTTLDMDLQTAAQQAVSKYLSWKDGPTASVVAIDNKTGEVRAMVGGRDYAKTPFNLATQGQRQPGSSIKPFILARALQDGVSPQSLWPSRKRVFTVPGSGGRDKFVVNNFEDSYAGTSTLANALTYSDNAVFAAVGIKVGTKRVASLAERMGIRTPVSSNYAMTLGGLQEGVTPLDMAHAYETFATGGLRISGTMGTRDDGPVGIDRITHGDGDDVLKANKVRKKRVLPAKVAETARELLQGPVRFGSATRAQYGGFAAGKTGTTENFGDAWFVGFTDRLTIAVWVGYPDQLKSMETEYHGSPVAGGTFPADIWREFVLAANRIYLRRANEERERKGLPPRTETTPTTTTTTPAPATPRSTTPVEGAAPEGTAPGGRTTGGQAPQEQEQQAPQQQPAPEGTAPPQTPQDAAPQTPQTPADPPPGTGNGTGAGSGGGVAAPPG